MIPPPPPNKKINPRHAPSAAPHHRQIAAHAPPSIASLADHRCVCTITDVPNVKFVSETPIDVAISDNLGFGGHNAALVFKRYTRPE